MSRRARSRWQHAARHAFHFCKAEAAIALFLRTDDGTNNTARPNCGVHSAGCRTSVSVQQHVRNSGSDRCTSPHIFASVDVRRSLDITWPWFQSRLLIGGGPRAVCRAKIGAGFKKDMTLEI
jgi:hypothetical protein